MIDPTLSKKVREAASKQAARGKVKPEQGLIDRLIQAASRPDLEDRISAARANRWAGAIPTHEHVVMHQSTEQAAVSVIGIDGSQIYPEPPVLWTYIEAVAYQVGTVPRFLDDFIDIGTAIDHGGTRAMEVLENLDDLQPLVNTWRTMLELETARQALQSTLKTPAMALMDNSLLPWMSVGSATTRLHLNEYVSGLASIEPRLIAGVVSTPQSRLLSALIRLGEANTIEEAMHDTENIPDVRIMFDLLEPGERSALFLHGSPRNDAFQREGAGIHFFFLRIDQNEMVRVEVPGWVAANPKAVETVQSSILKDSKGTGYSYVLSMAHNQVVIKRDTAEGLHELGKRALIEETGKTWRPSAKEAFKTA